MAFSNDDILTLAKAGFNAQQIAALNIVGTAPEVKAPETAPAPEVKAPESAPAPEVKAPESAPATTTIDDVLKSVKDLTATFQNGFMMNSQQPKPITAEDILANIINPPSPDKKEV